MRTTARTTAFILALLLPAGAWMTPSEHLTLQPQSKLWVEGTSTVRSFSCTAVNVNAIVDTRTGDAVKQLAAGDKAVLAVDVKVPAEKMDCGNGTMNDHMKKALKTNEAPTILFRLTSYDVARSGEVMTGTLKGTLSLGGAQKPVTITAIGRTEGEMLRVAGTTEVRMTEFGLTPPSLMFGRIKVGDMVTVHFDLLLKS